MPPLPGIAERRQYLAALLTWVDPNERKTQLRAVLTYLVERSVKDGPDFFLPLQTVIDDVPEVPQKEETATVCMSRVQGAVKRFQESKAARKLAVCADFEWGNKAIRFAYNHGDRDLPDSEETSISHLVAQFWSPYFDGKPSRILYPEPLFFSNGKDTYIRHIEVNSPDSRKSPPLPLEYEPMHACHPYVPAGVVGAMLRLISCFAPNNVRLEASPFRSGARITDRNENLIILGTLASMPLVSGLETSSPSRARNRHSALALRSSQFSKGAASYVEPALITRRHHLFRRNVVTVINSAHSRAVEAIVRFLTSDAEMESLRSAFDRTDGFPKFFQADFDVIMRRNLGEPDPDHVKLRKTLVLES